MSGELGLDPEIKHNLCEINENLRSQIERNEKDESGKKPAWKNFTDASKNLILRLSAKFGTPDSVSSEPADSFSKFAAVGSTANAQMLFAHMLSTKICRAFPTKGMVIELFGGMLLPLGDAQGLGFNVFGLPNTSAAEPLSEQEILLQQVNITDRQGISRDGPERMAVTI